MRMIAALIALVSAVALTPTASAAPVLMISVDGLRPGDIIEAKQRGVNAPILQDMVKTGFYSTGVRAVLPSLTFPDHITLVTGVWPSTHRVPNNTLFRPLAGNSIWDYYWYGVDIKAPTLWQAVHATGGRVASLAWPLTVGLPEIDDNVPAYWPAIFGGYGKLEQALISPGLSQAIDSASGIDLSDTATWGESIDGTLAKATAEIYRLKRPSLVTLHLTSMDNKQHKYGPGSKEAYDALSQTDTMIGELVAAARRVQPDLVVVIVSDHGFASVQHDINLIPAFVEAGLITVDASGKLTAWEAAPWTSGGSASVVLARRDDPKLRERVDALLTKLASDPSSGVGRVIGRQEIAKMGGAPDADYFIDAKIGYQFGSKTTGPVVTPGTKMGMHGYFPDNPEMRATLIISGPNLPVRGSAGVVDMRAIAPTVAKILGVPFPSAEVAPLF